MFKGSLVALVTPMHADGSLDKKSFHDLIEWHIQAKTDALVVAGTTGESATLDTDEKLEIITLAVKQVAKRIPVIAGTGSCSTQASIKLTQLVQRTGVDACLVVTPYYNKPSQNGLYQHYKIIAENTTLPVILYNVPGRTACDLLPETVERLAKIPNIIGIKEATGKLDRAIEIINRCGKQFAIYSGDDGTALELMLHGAQGVISVTANIAPRQMAELCKAALAGNKAQAETINAELATLHQKLFLESNPVPAKWALHEMGLISSGIRLPLLPLDAKYHQELRTALHQANITESSPTR